MTPFIVRSILVPSALVLLLLSSTSCRRHHHDHHDRPSSIIGGIVFVDASELDQAGETIDGLIDVMETIQLNTPNDCIMHVLNPVSGNVITIDADPPTLVRQYGFVVDPNIGGGTFLLYYDSPDTADQSGTIIINVPFDRPQNLIVSGSTNVLVNDGFNGLRSVVLDGSSIVNGYMVESQAERVRFRLNGSSRLTMEVGDDKVISIDQHSDQVELERVLTATASDSSSLSIKGNVTSMICEGSAVCVLDGTSVRETTLTESASFDFGTVTVDTTTTTPTGSTSGGSTCTNGPNPTLSADTDTGVSTDGGTNGDISGGGRGVVATSLVVVVVGTALASIMMTTSMM
jgi:hypothetical protein